MVCVRCDIPLISEVRHLVCEFLLVVPFGVVLVSGIVVGSCHWLNTATECFTNGTSWGILSGAHTGVCQLNSCY